MTTELEAIQTLQVLQDKLKSINHTLDLPMVIAVGSQSSGKSSVLEKIIRKDILPKGTNIVTRCPIKISLRSLQEGPEYVLIDDKKYTNFKSAQKYISLKMNEICGNGSKISKQEIEIVFYQRNCIEITLVDLPGITKIPINDQPKDIEKQIESLVLSYASLGNVLLLPIIAANTDISTSDALKLCRQIDPPGNKTLAILTKIDIMDTDTNCLAILQNKTHKLNLGYVGLINRGQFDLNNKIDIQAIILKEDAYFRNSQIYNNVNNVGTAYLNKRLQELFLKLTKESLVSIKSEIQTKLNSIKKEIAKLEVQNYTRDHIFSLFYKTITSILKQKHNANNLFVYSTENNLNVEFAKLFDLKNDKFIFSKAIIEEIKSSNSILLSDALFKKIIVERYAHLQIKIVERFESTQHLIIEHFCKIECLHYKNLLNTLQNELKNIIDLQKEKLIDSFATYMDIQMSYINTKHPDFNKFKLLENVITKHVQKPALCKNETNSFFNFLSITNEKTKNFSFIDAEFDVNLFYSFTNSYFASMEKSCLDHALKSAHYYFFVQSKRKIELRLNELVKNNNVDFYSQNEIILQRKRALETEEIMYKDILHTLNAYKNKHGS